MKKDLQKTLLEVIATGGDEEAIDELVKEKMFGKKEEGYSRYDAAKRLEALYKKSYEKGKK